MTLPFQFISARVQETMQPYRGRVLEHTDPAATSATVYNGEGLIVALDRQNASQVSQTLQDVLDTLHCDLEGPSWLRSGMNTQSPAQNLVSGVRIKPRWGLTPDPWLVLNDLRSQLTAGAKGAVGLNHLLITPERVGGNPFALGHGRVGLDAYGQATNGRGTVTLLASAPRSRPLGRRPRVVVLDTEVGPHWWFRDNPPRSRIRLQNGSILGARIYPYPRRSVTTQGVHPDALLGALGSRAGHGTFIAGLIRQSCPEAEIVAFPVMDADGVVPEHMLIRALDMILRKQSESPNWADAIVLSLGYYSETTDDETYTTGLKQVLLALGRAGVATFASAGNDRTERPSYPAAFAADPEFDGDALPVVSVAALDADGALAEFSNRGPWVTTAALGVNVVSTSAALDGSSDAPQQTTDKYGRIRSGVDADDFRGGFASWSGTSFATPTVAGRYLSALIEAGFPAGITERRQLLPSRQAVLAG